MLLSHVVVAYLWPCHTSILRNAHGPCHYVITLLSHVTIGFMAPVEFKKCPFRPVNFRGLPQYEWVLYTHILDRLPYQAYSKHYRLKKLDF